MTRESGPWSAIVLLTLVALTLGACSSSRSSVAPKIPATAPPTTFGADQFESYLYFIAGTHDLTDADVDGFCETIPDAQAASAGCIRALTEIVLDGQRCSTYKSEFSAAAYHEIGCDLYGPRGRADTAPVVDPKLPRAAKISECAVQPDGSIRDVGTYREAVGANDNVTMALLDRRGVLVDPIQWTETQRGQFVQDFLNVQPGVAVAFEADWKPEPGAYDWSPYTCTVLVT